MNQKRKTRVLIVDDSAFIRQLFTSILEQNETIEVIGAACDPYDAREKIKKLKPDVLTLDIEMPHMDGISFLEKIMALHPMPVIMVSTLTQRGAEATIYSLEVGAVDYIEKPKNLDDVKMISALKISLISKVKLASKARIRMASQPVKQSILPDEVKLKSSQHIIAIGASTGGVEALKEVLITLPESMPPILVTQHMPAGFTKSFADRLNSLCRLNVKEAINNEPTKRGHVYIAPGAAHLRIARAESAYICKVGGEEKVSSHCPSVDVLFHSFADVVGEKTIGVILTGMGRDGADGLARIREAGGYTIGQDEESCVVYGMSKIAKQEGAVVNELRLGLIANEMIKRCSA